MLLDEVKTTRRDFLKLIGAAVAGAYVPGLNLSVDAPAYKQPLVKEPEWLKQRHIFSPYWSMAGDGGVLSAAVHVPPTAQGNGELSLFWTSEDDVEVGWWADYLEMHIRGGDKMVSPRMAYPETVTALKTDGGQFVNKNVLGEIVMVPNEVLMIALMVPHGAPWDVREGPVMVHGLNLDFEAT
jgi:hypothetical protein